MILLSTKTASSIINIASNSFKSNMAITMLIKSLIFQNAAITLRLALTGSWSMHMKTFLKHSQSNFWKPQETSCLICEGKANEILQKFCSLANVLIKYRMC